MLRGRTANACAYQYVPVTRAEQDAIDGAVRTPDAGEARSLSPLSGAGPGGTDAQHGQEAALRERRVLHTLILSLAALCLQIRYSRAARKCVSALARGATASLLCGVWLSGD